LAGLDVRADVADEPRLRKVDSVFARRLKHEIRLRLPALTAILAAVKAVVELSNRRAAKLLEQRSVNCIERFLCRHSLRSVWLIRDDEDHPAVFRREI